MIQAISLLKEPAGTYNLRYSLVLREREGESTFGSSKYIVNLIVNNDRLLVMVLLIPQKKSISDVNQHCTALTISESLK